MVIRNNNNASGIRPHPPRWSSWNPNGTAGTDASAGTSSSGNARTSSKNNNAPATSSSTKQGSQLDSTGKTKPKKLQAQLTAVIEPNPFRDPSIAHCSVLTNDAARCRHLEETMFPRFLTLDCNQLDQFTMGRVENHDMGRNLGRIYIESLHLKDFSKDPEAILAHNNALLKETATKSAGKRQRTPTKKSSSENKSKETTSSMPSNSSSSKKKKAIEDQTAKKHSSSKSSNRSSSSSSVAPKGNKLSPEEMEKITNSNLLSQSYFGGMEGKRTWLLANSHKPGLGGGIAASHCQLLPSSTLHGAKSNEADPSESKKIDNKKPNDHFKALVSSEMKMKSLRKSMRLHDRTTMIDNFISNTSEDSRPQEDGEVKALERLIKPPTGFVMPDLSLENASDKFDFSASTMMTSSKLESDSKPASTPSNANTTGSSATKKSSSKKNDSASVTRTASSKRKLSSKADVEMNTDSNINNYDRAVREGKQASLAANLLMEAFRRNRRKFWNNEKHGGDSPTCLWCPCRKGTKKKSSNREFGAIVETSHDSLPTASGDSLIQCLECDMVGCGPTFLDNRHGNNQHVMLHFLMSGHKFGVTCGPMGELFCMGCGDFVYHECFDQERERLFVEMNFPSLCWKETPILRGVDPSSFIITPEQGVMWRGMMATYPTPVSTQIVHASRFAAKRLSIFHGYVGERTTDWGPKALALSIYQQRHSNERPIPAPVGVFNLGNTCFMTAVLQCLIHCPPLQDLFLRDMIHPYKCCEALRWGSNKLSCLTCELDKIFLEYYGSSVGIDAIAALEEQRIPSEAYASKTVEPGPDDDTSKVGLIRSKKQHPDHRGHPVIPSFLLAEIWKNIGSIAGHDQHDSQEFFQAFLDSLENHTLFYQKSAREMRQVSYQSDIMHSPSFDLNQVENADIDKIKKLFHGTLRSTLICENCGCKRVQFEPFLSLSLPLSKELAASTEYEDGTKSITRRGKISVEVCLEHFTLPEVLSDPVYCPSCATKTKTLKQHTLSKLPKVLCLHLKRFDAAGNKKINDFVSFPSHGLDLGPYLPHWSEKTQGEKELQIGAEQNHTDCPQILYDLFGTVNHKGTLNQGHYFCRVKCGDQWFSCNDSFVSKLGETAVLQSDSAYMLFYIRQT